MASKEMKVTAGYGGDQAFLRLAEWTPRSEGNLDFDVEEIAEYTLQYLPDTNEIALVRVTPNGVGSNLNEIVYSEEVS